MEEVRRRNRSKIFRKKYLVDGGGEKLKGGEGGFLNLLMKKRQFVQHCNVGQFLIPILVCPCHKLTVVVET